MAFNMGDGEEWTGWDRPENNVTSGNENLPISFSYVEDTLKYYKGPFKNEIFNYPAVIGCVLFLSASPLEFPIHKGRDMDRLY